MKQLWTLALLLSVLTGFQACKTIPPANYNIQKSVIGGSSMVVTPHPLASDIGEAILRQGGNAIDAAVAIQLAIAVVYPRAGNIGGGGLMVIRRANGEIDALDYREKAPMAAGRNMYLDEQGNVRQGLSTAGHLAAGVPGTVAGLAAAHQKYGRLPWKKLVEPSLQLAKNGFYITQGEADRLSNYQADFKKYNTQPSAFVKQDWKPGDVLRQSDLARSLRYIRDKGAAGFYQGPTADAIVAEMKRGGGLITHEDLKAYEAKWRRPVEGRYKNYRIISMPPPSSGGIALIQLMKMIEPYPLRQWGFHSPEAIHLMAEAERRAYADRAQYLGDSDFFEVPARNLLDSVYLGRRMDNFQPGKASRSDSLLAGVFVGKESFETEHTSVVDAEGNAVAVTTTLNSNYGCKVVVGGAGFFLNNEMDDFSVKPGVPNQFGLVGAEANAIAPGKRMLSSMTPTILERDGKLFLVLGAPGGSTIITAVFQVIVNVVEFGMDLEEAVKAGRFHHQWLPDQIMVEKGSLSEGTRRKLQDMGHQLRDVDRMAIIKAILIRPDGRRYGVGDPRNPDDDAQGY